VRTRRTRLARGRVEFDETDLRARLGAAERRYGMVGHIRHGDTVVSDSLNPNICDQRMLCDSASHHGMAILSAAPDAPGVAGSRRKRTAAASWRIPRPTSGAVELRFPGSRSTKGCFSPSTKTSSTVRVKARGDRLRRRSLPSLTRRVGPSEGALEHSNAATAGEQLCFQLRPRRRAGRRVASPAS